MKTKQTQVEREKPSRLEVVSQIGKDFIGAGKSILINPLTAGLLMPYFIPRTIRFAIDADRNWKKLGDMPAGIPLIGTAVSGLLQTLYWLALIEKGTVPKEYGYLPLLTNGLSLVYELGRATYKSAEEKIIRTKQEGEK